MKIIGRQRINSNKISNSLFAIGRNMNYTSIPLSLTDDSDMFVKRHLLPEMYFLKWN